MLSYRHGYHAGNFADVHKHILLTLMVQALLRKDAPFCYLDTHAGAGFYDLHSEFARQNTEYQNGIGRLWRRQDVPPEINSYLEAVYALHPDQKNLRYYPGSPRLVHYFLRPQDRMILTELHSSDFPLLKKEFAGDRQVAVHFQDGYLGLKSFLPPKERRGLVLIDPAYELKDEFERATTALHMAWKRWETGVFALWYPILTRHVIDRFHRRLKATGIRKMLLAELIVVPDDVPNRLNGSGMIIVNPPWHLQQQIEKINPWLAETLALDKKGKAKIEWLVPE